MIEALKLHQDAGVTLYDKMKTIRTDRSRHPIHQLIDHYLNHCIMLDSKYI